MIWRRLTGYRARWLLGAALAVASGGWWLTGTVLQSEEVTWTEATVGDLIITVAVEGKLASKDSSVLGPPQVPGLWDYKITTMAPEGEAVDAGTPVLGFDTSELEMRLRDRQNESEQAAKNREKLDADVSQHLEESELKLAEAEARRRKARLKVDRPGDLTAARELQQARLDLELAEMEVKNLEGQIAATRRSGAAQRAMLEAQKNRADRQVQEIEDAIERMTVKASRSGTVIYVTNWRDEKKKVGDSAWRGERIIELPNLQTMMAQGEVDEADAGRVAEGQPFRIRLDAHPDLEYSGTVASIWSTVRRKSSSRNPLKVVRLDLELADTDTRRMRPGMRFRGTVETDRLPGVLLMPAHAVFPTASGPIVYRRTLFGYQKVSVTLGRRNESLVQILEGLEASDRVAESNPES
ncbi:MAG: HlyD family secretion protein [Acidobacteriota bacterium]